MTGVAGSAAEIEWANPGMAAMAPHGIADFQPRQDNCEVEGQHFTEDDECGEERCQEQAPEEVEAAAKSEQPEGNEHRRREEDEAE